MPHSGAAASRGDRDNDNERRSARAAAARADAWLESSGAWGESADRYPAEVSDRPGGVPGRRTVTIRGQGAERYVPIRSSSRRRPERRYERAGFRPDRAAMWAVMLGVMLILAAAASAHA
jgi:hypothetical protein